MGPFGVQEMMVIVVVALLLFGPKKLPELARILGKGLTEFRRAKNELTSTLNMHMRELEREVQVEEAKKKPVTSAAIPAYNPYSYMADEYGKVASDYNPGNAAIEPPVESHAAPVSEPPALTPGPVVNGTVARSASPFSDVEIHSENGSANGRIHDEHLI